ncbi:hypothetical protein WT25_02035 [Burkholderia territorii]|nr:hypothetical protein WT25_02035 [Burkholderia territorii]
MTYPLTSLIIQPRFNSLIHLRPFQLVHTVLHQLRRPLLWIAKHIEESIREPGPLIEMVFHETQHCS